MSLQFRSVRAASVAGRTLCERCGGWKSTEDRERKSSVAPRIAPPRPAAAEPFIRKIDLTKPVAPPDPDALANAIRERRQRLKEAR